MLRLFIATLSCALYIVLPLHAAEAQESPTAAADLARMESDLTFFVAESKRDREVLGLTTVGFAAVLVPVGVVVRMRGDGESDLVSGALIFGGATPLIPAVASIFPARVETLAIDLERARARGLGDEAVVADIETSWRAAAETSHKRRVRIGIVGSVLGAAALGTGLTFMLARPPSFGLSETTQYTLGSAFFGAAVPITALSIRMLTLPSVEERSWDAFVSGGLAPRAGSASRLPSLAVMPTHGGAMGSLGMMF
jgi:hypothetical protein